MIVLFLSSSLLFVIQPIIGKIVTAKYGGGAQVWCLSLFFFQLILFLGYLFSFILCRQKIKIQIAIYGLLLCALFFFADVPWGNEWAPDRFEHPIRDLLLSFLYFLGLPCFILGTVSTLLQKWYHQLEWGEPYYLYSVSNIGSMLCLLAYPFVIEPVLSIQDSLLYWRYLLMANGFLLLLCCVVFFVQIRKVVPKVEKLILPNRKQQLVWLVCSALGTMLLVSVTQHITSDIAPIPLLWLVPLLIYLLSFVLNFNRSPLYNDKSRLFYIIVAQILTFITIFDTTKSFDDLGHYLFVLFFATIVIHGELYARRPTGEFLPSFYLIIAFGGMLGSMIVNFLFPLILKINIDSVISLCAFIAFSFFILKYHKVRIFFLDSIDRHYRFAVSALSLALIISLVFKRDTILDERNFYGSISLKRYDLGGGQTALRLLNGAIIHGFQFEAKDKSAIPTSYYNLNSPFSLVMNVAREKRGRQEVHVGGVGLGIGTIATYLEENDKAIFYEIDPKVIKIAKQHFTYLKETKGDVDILTGDGRLVLDRQTPQSFDVLLIDAFNSDAVPTHLLTLEAFNIYLKHLKSDGFLMFHISNRFLDLEKICEVNAKEMGLGSVSLRSKALNMYQTDALYCVLFRKDDDLIRLSDWLKHESFKNIRMIKSDLSSVSSWSDSFSNLYSILKID